MRGAARGAEQRIITLAHQIEAMARQKSLKPLRHYLRDEKPGSSNQAVIDMFKRMAAQGDGVKIRTVERRAPL